MEEYLTVKGLSRRIKLAVQAICNFIPEEKFILAKHYLKPTPKKILFKWPEIKERMGEGTEVQGHTDEMSSEPKTGATPPKTCRPGKNAKIKTGKESDQYFIENALLPL